MWLATKEAAKGQKIPSLRRLQEQLGSLQSAISYKRLFEDHPEVELGPDEDRLNHFKRLKRQHEFWQSTDTTEKDRRAADPKVKVVPEPNAKTPAWLTLRDQDQAPAVRSTSPAAPTPGFHSGLPHRIPGWYTGDAVAAPPPGFGTPPMSRRDPSSALRAPTSPDARPQQQSYEDWEKWLGGKGIYLDQGGRRLSPEQAPQQRALHERHRLTGPEAWHSLVDTPGPDYRGRHRAARVVVAYIDGVLLGVDGAEITKVSWEEAEQ